MCTLANLAGELTLETVTGDMQIEHAVADPRPHPDHQRRSASAHDAGARCASGCRSDQRRSSFLLRQPIDAEFDIETFNGEIDNCFGPKSVRTHEFAPGNALRFKEGAGSARVRVKTLNGGVEICK